MVKQLAHALKQRLRNSRREQKEWLIRRVMQELFGEGELGPLAKKFGVDELMSGVCIWGGGVGLRRVLMWRSSSRCNLCA